MGASTINRRDFLKVFASITTIAGVSGFGVASGKVSFPGDCFRCQGCDSLNVEDTANFLTSYFRPAEYCHSCGMNVQSLQYDIDCQFLEDGVSGSYLGTVQDCCQVPFPNHELLKESDKPQLVLSKLKF